MTSRDTISISALGDLHENFHLAPPKESDLFLFAGDFFARRSDNWQEEVLRQYHQLPYLEDWLQKIPAEHMFLIAGNSDYLLRALGEPTINYWLKKKGIPATYLENTTGKYNDISIWGTPHAASSPDGTFPLSSAFVLDEKEYEKEVILPRADIVLSHNSPLFDFPEEKTNVLDSPAAARHLRQEIIRTAPELFVSGHFHWMRGSRKIGETTQIVPAATEPYMPGKAPYGLVSEDPYLYTSL